MSSIEELVASQQTLIGVRANLVANTRGDFSGKGGSSRDLSNQTDREVLIRLRALADVIVTDGATAAAENYQPTKWAPIQVWSQSGNFRGLLEKNGMQLVQISDPAKALERLLTEYQSVLLETGPTVTRLLAAHECIDQLKLTLVAADSINEANQSVLAIKNRLGLEYLNNQTWMKVKDSYFFTCSR